MAGQNKDAIERLQRGLIIALIAIVGILVVVLAVRMLRGGTELLSPITTQSGPTGSETAGDVENLLGEARRAMADSRLVAPAGSNAYEHYLAVLDQQSDNVSAREALNDLYGIAVSSAEQAIAAGDFDDADRLATMLSRSNPNSFTVNNLRQRIERGRAATAAAEVAAQQQQQQRPDSAETAAPATTTAAPPPEPASDLASVTSPSAPPSQPAPGPSTTPATTTTTPPRTTTTTTAAAPASTGVREARLLTRVDPEYPREAMRGRQQGWVELEFTIGRDGSVSDIQVVAARPSRIFDRAATRALQEWRFEPRMENGQPVATRLRQRFDFRLD